jgi:hypothetical protein
MDLSSSYTKEITDITYVGGFLGVGKGFVWDVDVELPTYGEYLITFLWVCCLFYCLLNANFTLFV